MIRTATIPEWTLQQNGIELRDAAREVQPLPLSYFPGGDAYYQTVCHKQHFPPAADPVSRSPHSS